MNYLRPPAYLFAVTALAFAPLHRPPAFHRTPQSGGRVQERTRIDTTFAFNPTGEVSLSLPGGEIRVTAWARNEARVVAVSERGDIAASFSRNRIRLEINSRLRSTGVTRYEVNVPIGVRVSATTVSGSINVSGTRGDLSLTTMNGPITASDGKGRSEIETASGRIVLQRFEGTTRVSGLSTTAAITEISGDLEIEALSSRVTVDRGDLSSLRFEAAAGTLDFSGTLSAQGRHSIETLAGNVTLTLPADFAATIELETFTGSLRPGDFTVTLRPSGGSERGRNSEREQYTINGGGARLSIQTFSGDVFLRKLGAPTRR